MEKEDIEEIVKSKLNHANFELVNYNFHSDADVKGMMGDHSFLKVLIKEKQVDSKEEKLNFFVKMFPKDEYKSEICKQANIFMKEIGAYVIFDKIKAENAKLLNVVPNCYKTKTEGYLVFNDLKQEGYKTLQARDVINYETALKILQSLSTLHASSIIYEEKQSKTLEREYSLFEDYANIFDAGYFSNSFAKEYMAGSNACAKGLQAEIEIYNFPETLLSGKKFLDVASDLFYKLNEMVKPSKKYRNVICHGDLWGANILIKYDDENKPSNCKLVDFQTVVYCTPAHDVMFALYLLTNREFRKKHLYELLGIYYNMLEKQLKLVGIDVKEILGFNAFLDSCEEKKVYAVVQTAIYYPLILLKADNLQKVINVDNLLATAFSEDKGILLRSIPRDDYYDNRLQESLMDLKEICDYL